MPAGEGEEVVEEAIELEEGGRIEVDGRLEPMIMNNSRITVHKVPKTQH
jgi:hypothetical protein